VRSTFLPEKRVRGRSAGSFPEQRLVIEPKIVDLLNIRFHSASSTGILRIHQYRRGHGLQSRLVRLNFFQALILLLLLSCVHNRAMIKHVFSPFSEVQIYDLSYIHLQNSY